MTELVELEATEELTVRFELLAIELLLPLLPPLPQALRVSAISANVSDFIGVAYFFMCIRRAALYDNCYLPEAHTLSACQSVVNI